MIDLPAASTRAMGGLAQRSMRLQCTIQDAQVWLTDAQNAAQFELVTFKAPRIG